MKGSVGLPPILACYQYGSMSRQGRPKSISRVLITLSPPDFLIWPGSTADAIIGHGKPDSAAGPAKLAFYLVQPENDGCDLLENTVVQFSGDAMFAPPPAP